MFTFQIPTGLPILPTVSRNDKYTVTHYCINNKITGIIYKQIASYNRECVRYAVADECVYLNENKMLKEK